MFEYVQVQMRGMAEGNTIVAPFIIKTLKWLSKIHKLYRDPFYVFVLQPPFTVIVYVYFGWIACIVLKLHPLI